MKKRTVALLTAACLLVAACVYVFTPLGKPQGSCALVSLGSGVSSPGTPPFNVVPVGGQNGPYSGTGKVTWCVYGSYGYLERSYATDRLIDGIATSADGRSIVVAGYEISPGRGGAYVNGGVFLFNRQGQMLWNVTTFQPVSSVGVNGDGSVIVADAMDVLYLNNEGRVLWNYSDYVTNAMVLVNDGSDVLAGVSEIPFPNNLNYGSALTMFDGRGAVVWNVSIPDQLFDSGESIAVSSGHIVAGLTLNGYSGTMYYYDLQGTLIWSRPVDSAILQVSFVDNGSSILIQTNWGNVKFDLAGNVISNFTASHSPDG